MYNAIELLLERKSGKQLLLKFDWRLEGLYEALRMNWPGASHFLIHRTPVSRLHLSQRSDHFVPKDERSSSTLQIAVQYSGLAIVEALLHPAQSYPSTDSVNQPLEDDNQLAGLHAYVNYLDDEGRSAVHYFLKRSSSVSSTESEDILRLLIKRGLNVK